MASPGDAVGLNVRRARRERGMSLEQLAGRIGRSKGWLSMIENGHLALEKRSDITALADVLEVPAAGLLSGPFAPGPMRGTCPLPFPVAPDIAAVARHERLARDYLALAARGDMRGAAEWLRRLARDPGVSPWLLTERIGVIVAESHAVRMPAASPLT